MAERMLTGAHAAPLERRSMAWWGRFWNRKYGWLAESLRVQRFKRRPGISTNHLHDFQGYVLDEVARRFAAAGLSVPLWLD